MKPGSIRKLIRERDALQTRVQRLEKAIVDFYIEIASQDYRRLCADTKALIRELLPSSRQIAAQLREGTVESNARSGWIAVLDGTPIFASARSTKELVQAHLAQDLEVSGLAELDQRGYKFYPCSITWYVEAETSPQRDVAPAGGRTASRSCQDSCREVLLSSADPRQPSEDSKRKCAASDTQPVDYPLHPGSESVKPISQLLAENPSPLGYLQDIWP